MQEPSLPPLEPQLYEQVDALRRDVADLFVVSDTTLALGRFVEPRSWTRPVTMLTYHGAQALIVVGLLA